MSDQNKDQTTYAVEIPIILSRPIQRAAYDAGLSVDDYVTEVLRQEMNRRAVAKADQLREG